MHWIIIGVKPAYYLKLFWTMWCPEISLSKNLCNWGINSVSLQEWRNLYGIVLYQNFFCSFITLCITSACGSQVHGSYVCHNDIWIDQWVNNQLWIWHSFWHENLWHYQDNFINKIACCYSKDSQKLELLWFTIDYTHCIINFL